MSLRKYLATGLTALMLAGCGTTRERTNYVPPRDLSEVQKRYASREPSYRQIEGYPVITDKTLLNTLIENNPDIKAARDSDEHVRLLSEATQLQYTPQFNIAGRSRLRGNGGDFKDLFRNPDATDTSFETSVTQRWNNGVSIKGYVDLTPFTADPNAGNGIYGLEVQWLLPGSATLAQQQVADLVALSEPARERANVTEISRAKTREVISQFYGAMRSLQIQRRIETEITQPTLERVYRILEERHQANPNDAHVRSDISTIESRLTNSRKIVDSNQLEEEDVKRGLIANLGIRPEDVAQISFSYEGIDDSPTNIPLEVAVERAILYDPTIQRSVIEMQIASARAEAAEKKMDITLGAGVFDGVDRFIGHGNTFPEQETYAGVAIQFSTGIFSDRHQVSADAHRASARAHENRIAGRISAVSTAIGSIYQNARKNEGVKKVAEHEKERKKKSFEEAFEAFTRGENWANIDRMLDLMESWRASALESEETQRILTRDKRHLLVDLGTYDNGK